MNSQTLITRCFGSVCRVNARIDRFCIAWETRATPLARCYAWLFTLLILGFGLYVYFAIDLAQESWLSAWRGYWMAYGQLPKNAEVQFYAAYPELKADPMLAITRNGLLLTVGYLLGWVLLVRSRRVFVALQSPASCESG